MINTIAQMAELIRGRSYESSFDVWSRCELEFRRHKTLDSYIAWREEAEGRELDWTEKESASKDYATVVEFLLDGLRPLKVQQKPSDT